jgi:putative ABC transport system permease protein
MMSWLHAVRERAANLFGGPSRDRGLAEEIAYHLELETQRQIAAGCDPAVARARALARFGNPRHVTDATRDERGVQPLEGGMQDVKWAMRSLRKSPGFTALALVTLVLGIGAATVAFSVLDTVLLRPLAYGNAQRLVFIQEKTAKQALRPPSYPNFSDWRDRARSFDGVVSAQYPFGTTVTPGTAGSDPVRVPLMGVSRRFFATLGVRPAIGREFTDDENKVGGPFVVMATYEFWQTQMGGRRPLGSVRFGDDIATVVGVLPPNFQFLTPADLYYPHERGPGTVRSAHNYMVVGRLASNATLASARAEMAALSKSLLATYGNATEAVDTELQPLKDHVVDNYRAMLAVVFGAAALVLLIACTNLVSAQLARGWAREREVVIRAALGASRARLTRQLFVESALLVGAGATIAAVLAGLATRVVRTIGAGVVPRLNELAVDGRVFGFVALVAMATALVVGVYPALRLARGNAGLVLRATRGSSTTVRTSVWRLLVGFEIALAVVLLVGSALLIRTLHNILTAETGIVSRGVVTASISPRQEDIGRIDQLKNELQHLPGVESIAFADRLPFAWGNRSAPVRRPGDPADHDWVAFAGFRVVTPEYFPVLRQPMLRGRGFLASDRDGAPAVAIISPGIAEKLWPGLDPIGRTISTNYLFDQWLTVVGVVTEASSWTMPRGSQNEIYVPLAQHPKSTEGQLVAVLRTTGDPHAVIPSLRARLRELVPHSPAQIGTMDDRIAKSAADRRFAMLALTVFGAIALVLAAVGIYGVIWYIVTTRTHEIGVRMALGATAGNVQREILSGAVAMAAGGILVGSVGGVFATRFLQSTLYGVSRLDPSTYVAGAVIALLAAVLGALLPARRTSRIDPMIALRGDG